MVTLLLACAARAPDPVEAPPLAPPTDVVSPEFSGPTPYPSAVVTVIFSGEVVPAFVEVFCEQAGFRRRDAVVDGTVRVPGVPVGQECTLFPKGGVVSTSSPVRAGASYACTVIGTTTSCSGG